VPRPPLFLHAAFFRHTTPRSLYLTVLLPSLSVWPAPTLLIRASTQRKSINRGGALRSWPTTSCSMPARCWKARGGVKHKPSSGAGFALVMNPTSQHSMQMAGFYPGLVLESHLRPVSNISSAAEAACSADWSRHVVHSFGPRLPFHRACRNGHVLPFARDH